MAAFNVIDFQLNANRDLTLSIAILDQDQQYLTVPDGSVGHFAVSKTANSAPIFERDTSVQYVRITTPGGGSPEYFLECDFLPADTAALVPGTYYYETKVDLGPKTYTLKSGLFLLLTSLIPS